MLQQLFISIIKEQPGPQLTYGGLAMSQMVSDTTKQCLCSTSMLNVAYPASRRDQSGSTPLR